jgi:formylglycine-generating enzyme required for sulfatase activity
MVYIPEGSFSAGDGTSALALRQGSTDGDPWEISSENAISVTNTSGDGYYYPGGGDGAAATFNVPGAYPKGFRGFYIMRHEITQEQWRNFFNTLPQSGLARANRDCTAASGKNSDGLVARNNLSWLDLGSAFLPDQGGSTTYCNVPMSYLSWADLTAYLDWAGLRPMSELEFEKAARGVLPPVAAEYAWGTNTYTNAAGITDSGSTTEAPSNSGANSNLAGAISGPVRIASFASLNYGNASRINSGGSYYGVLELSGNLRERVVTLGNSTGRNFTALHGDGSVSSTGEADVSAWPGSDGVGAGFRGGSWNDPADAARISDRSAAATADPSRAADFGGRGVRH